MFDQLRKLPGHWNSGPNPSEVGLFGTMRPSPWMPRLNLSPTSEASSSATEHPVSAAAARRHKKRVMHLTRSILEKTDPQWQLSFRPRNY